MVIIKYDESLFRLRIYRFIVEIELWDNVQSGVYFSRNFLNKQNEFKVVNPEQSLKTSDVR